MPKRIKGTDVPGVTFDALLILCFEWYTKYKNEKWADVYEQITTILGYTNSSMNRYRDFFKYGLISIGWLNEDRLSYEACNILSHIKINTSGGLIEIRPKITLFNRKEQKKNRREVILFIRLSDLIILNKAIKRNKCIRSIIINNRRLSLINRNRVVSVLSDLHIFSVNKSTIIRRASDVYNWINWLQRIDNLNRPGTISSGTVF